VLAALLAALTIAYSVKDRSLKPLAFVAGVCLATVVVSVATKIAVGRLNPHGMMGEDGAASLRVIPSPSSSVSVLAS
jgi:hypothetical protein